MAEQDSDLKRSYNQMNGHDDGSHLQDHDHDHDHMEDHDHQGSGTDSKLHGSFRTRPIRSCTHCRQQKIKCDASETFPAPCTRCAKMDRKCRVDPYFKPQKGGQVQSLRDDLTMLRQQVEYLQQRESLLASAVAKADPTNHLLTDSRMPGMSPVSSESPSYSGPSHPPVVHASPLNGLGRSPAASSAHAPAASQSPVSLTAHGLPLAKMISSASDSSKERKNKRPTEYAVGDVRLPAERAEELHRRFMTSFLPYMPIIQSNSAAELYGQSELLFWTVCLTASLSEPEPSLYLSLCGVIKQLAIETCWIRTPRSTHIVQALIILGNWPIPNEKVLDDCSYRFIGLAKSLAMQLGLHRGKFIYEFSRTQTALPDAEKWRTRTWVSLFFSEQVWSANLGLPPTIPIDYLVDKATDDESLPASFRSLVRCSVFYYKLVNLMGSSVSQPDGLLDGMDRPTTLAIMERQLDAMESGLAMNEPSVEIYFLYIRLMVCLFAFLPGMPDQDQAKYVVTAFQAGTRVITLMSKLSEARQLIEYPIYMRQAVTFSAFTLFRLHLSPLLQPQHVESARQSVVTVHRLFRNMLTAWKDVENDISRTAKVLEKLNFVIITHPYLFTQAPNIITRMRSHLTASMFYELIWGVHEARRRGTSGSNNSNNSTDKKKDDENVPQALRGPKQPPSAFAHLDTVPPLPFYNQITKDDFKTHIETTPNGTTVTTLVPTHPNATLQVFGMNSGFSSATASAPPEAAVDVASSSTVQQRQQHLQQLLQQQQHQQQDQQQLQSNQSSQAAASQLGSSASQPQVAGAQSQIAQSTVPSQMSQFDWHQQVQDHSGAGTGGVQTPGGMAALLDSTGASNDPLHLDTLMQGIDWMNDKGDDFLGWMDVNVSPF